MITLSTNAQRLLQLFHRMRTARSGPATAALKQLNLSFSHMAVLRFLSAVDALPLKDVAEKLQITPPAVTAITRRLVQTDLARRAPHTEDSRVVLLSITPAGRALLDQFHAEHLAEMERLLAGLSEAEQRQFLDLLERAVDALTAPPTAAEGPQPAATA